MDKFVLYFKLNKYITLKNFNKLRRFKKKTTLNYTKI